MSDSPWVVDATSENFQEQVFAKSHETAIVVDFWAAWCAPCRQLAPVLEKLAEEHEGRFVLVKANTEEVPEAAGQFQVTGIPAVFGVVDGEIVDFFNGALPEEHVREWLSRLFASSALAEAKRLEDIAPEHAEVKYRAIVEQSPKDIDAKIGLARVLVARESFEDAQAVIDELESRGFLEPEAEKVKSALDLHAKGGVDLGELRGQIEAAPEDLSLQLQLAEALAATDEYEESLQICLSLVEKDRHGIGDEARQRMIDIFRVLPDDSELTTTYRRKLSLALY